MSNTAAVARCACGRMFAPKRTTAKLCDDCKGSHGSRTYEAEQQKAFIAHARKRGDLPVSPLNGAHLAGGYKDWSRLKAMGAAKGYPDVHLEAPVGKPGLYVEMKAPGNSLTPEQVEWRDHVTELGHTHVVAYSAVEAIEAYEAWRASLRGA
jgi:hypothetical protein